jgi:hypothetical protein
MMIRNLLFFLATMSTAVLASETPDLQDNRAVIQVKGVVCSFCAYGTEKNLSKLDFLDKSVFGGDGVLLDINTHRITLALNSAKPLDLGAINQAILDGGYDPLTAFVRLHGRIELQDNSTLLICNSNGQSWRLMGDSIPTNAQEVVVEGRISAADFSTATTSHHIPVSVTKVEVRQ